MNTFFEYGEVNLLLTDFESRYVFVEVCMPNCLFQTVTPHLLPNGLIDNLKVRDPIAIWLPQLSDDRFYEHVRCVDNLSQKMNVAIREEVLRISKLFIHLQSYLINPSDVIPMLPLGVYVTFKYRCPVDNIIKIIEGINSINVFGVNEFQIALAHSLNEALDEFSKVEPNRLICNE